MFDQARRFGMRIVYQVTMPRRQNSDLEIEQSPQRLQVRSHIPIGRSDDDGRALHHMITGEQHPGLGQQEAEMIGRVTGSVYGAQGEAVELDCVAVSQRLIQHQLDVVFPARRRRSCPHFCHRGDFRARGFLQCRGGRGMIEMGMRAQNPTNPPRAGVQNRPNMGRVLGPRINDRELPLADEISIGAGTGHDSRIRRNEAGHVAVEFPRYPRRQVWFGASHVTVCESAPFRVCSMTSESDYASMLAVALQEARTGMAEGGIPIGAALFHRSGRLLGSGHNRRVQEGDPSVHGETDAFRKAGRQRNYRDTIMVTTLAPCWYCSGLIVQFQIGAVVVGESRTFRGGIDWLRERGIEVIDLDSPDCVQLLESFITKHPEVWNEDIGEP